MKLSLKMTQPKRTVEKAIVVGLKPQLDKHLRTAARNIQRRIRALFKRAFLHSETYRSLTRGDLWHEFGLVDPKSKLDTILEFLLNNITVVPSQFKGLRGLAGFTGGLRIFLLSLDFSELYSLDGGVQITEKGETLDWLNWLLEQGGKIIVRDYKYRAIKSQRSRSGLGLMINVQTGRWNVPVEFQGTRQNNWLTRIITEIEPEIKFIIEDEVAS